MIIYLDVFIIENMILNLIIFVSVSIISKTKINFFRLIISSLVGSIYTFMEYYFLENQNIILKCIFKFLISILICFGAFKVRKSKKIKLWLLFVLITFIYGGISYAVLNIFNFDNDNLYEINSNIIGIFPMKVIWISFLVGFIIIYLVSIYFNKKINLNDIVCNIEINIEDKIVKTKALIDSGNLLIDPISKKEVIVVESKILKSLLTDEYLDVLKNISIGKLIGSLDINKYKIKIIPFNSLGNPNGILCVINPDFIKVQYEDEIILKNVILGVYFGSLNSFDEYSSIIGLGCLKEEIV